MVPPSPSCRRRFSGNRRPACKRSDESFYLTSDGAFIARGPNRATVENWQYQAYSVVTCGGVTETVLITSVSIEYVGNPLVTIGDYLVD